MVGGGIDSRTGTGATVPTPTTLSILSTLSISLTNLVLTTPLGGLVGLLPACLPNVLLTGNGDNNTLLSGRDGATTRSGDIGVILFGKGRFGDVTGDASNELI